MWLVSHDTVVVMALYRNLQDGCQVIISFIGNIM